ncbi:MAG: hypothetical protein LBC85_00675 [Fibromonadaceae bacterium]|jgi:hypothetical protein|nr:hypothetical protein [Fibromonadaceae bacterium]
MNFQLILIAAFLLVSCSGYDREEFRMEVGKRYDLKRWPDSAYIDTLDLFFAQEPVRQRRKQKVDITMSMGNNTVSLPRKAAAPLAPSTPSKRIESPARSVQRPAASSFPDQFIYALNRLLENPNNREFGRKYQAKGGETIDDLLLRIYGSQARRVPKFVSESMIKQLNPRADFTSLSEGELVTLPVVR